MASVSSCRRGARSLQAPNSEPRTVIISIGSTLSEAVKYVSVRSIFLSPERRCGVGHFPTDLVRTRIPTSNMDPVAERAASYMLRATQLLELAATLRDEQSKQVLVETASYYE